MKSCGNFGLECGKSQISSKQTSAEPLRMKHSKKIKICNLKKNWQTFRAQKHLLKIKRVSPDENPVSLLISTFNSTYAYAYVESIAAFILFALAGGVAKRSSDRDQDH